MQLIKENFPYPVLSENNDDYIEECSFSTVFNKEEIIIDYNNRTFNIPIKYLLKSKTLKSLIENKDAVCAVYVRCSAASYGELFKFKHDKNEMTISIPLDRIAHKLEVTGQIIAVHDLAKPYRSTEFNKIYFDSMQFKIEKGNFLALETPKSIVLNISMFEKPIESIFTIDKNNDYTYTLPCFSYDKIRIYVDDKTYTSYNAINSFNNGSLIPITIANIIRPVLTDAIKYIQDALQNNDTVFNELRWFEVITYKAKLIGIDLADESQNMPPSTIANKLLDGIASNSMESLIEVLTTDINDEGDIYNE